MEAKFLQVEVVSHFEVVGFAVIGESKKKKKGIKSRSPQKVIHSKCMFRCSIHLSFFFKTLEKKKKKAMRIKIHIRVQCRFLPG